MTDMKNGDFPSRYPEFERPTTPGKMIGNLLDAALAGVFLDENNFQSDYVRNLLGANNPRVSLFPNENVNTYNFNLFKLSGDINQCIINIKLKYLTDKKNLYINVVVSDLINTDDMLFENFIKNENLKWKEKDGNMTMEAMAIHYRTNHPYGFKSFETSFECDKSSHTINLNTTESGHISDMVIIVGGIIL